MKKTIKLAVVAALALGATSAFATNGATMIGYGAKSFGMGGTGIGVSHGAESALANPAMITTVEGTEVSFGGTVFMPDVSSTNTFQDNLGAWSTTSADSASDIFMIPSISIASKVNDNFSIGLGMWGTGGLGVDYRDTAFTDNQMSMVTSLAVMQFGVPLVYTSNNFSIGITPLLQYGALDIQYTYPVAMTGGTESAMGTGINDDLEFGYTLGLAYETNGITLGAVYKSEIEMEYQGVLSTVVTPFTGGMGYTNDKLSTPAEYGVGISYTTAGHTLAVDYKNIAWSDAEGYKDFEWEDQDVIAIGYEYATTGWAVRCGYQYAESAIKEQAVTWSGGGVETNINSAYLSAGTINVFNAVGFPGNMESHVTVGGTYNFSDRVSLDLAYVASLEAKDTYTNFMGADVSVNHSEDAISFQVNLAF